MTDQTQPTPKAAGGRRRPSLYRTVLSLGIAAIVATWLPFSVLYITALSRPSTLVATTVKPTSAVPAAAVTAGQPAATPIPVSTRAS